MSVREMSKTAVSIFVFMALIVYLRANYVGFFEDTDLYFSRLQFLFFYENSELSYLGFITNSLGWFLMAGLFWTILSKSSWFELIPSNSILIWFFSFVIAVIFFADFDLLETLAALNTIVLLCSYILLVKSLKLVDVLIFENNPTTVKNGPGSILRMVKFIINAEKEKRSSGSVIDRWASYGIVVVSAGWLATSSVLTVLFYTRYWEYMFN